MFTNVYPALDQGYVNKLLEKFQIYLDGILYELVELGFTAKQLLDCNVCISKIHRTYLLIS